jgi:UDP-glucose:(heptosyl)LPS alpha-1,3-glucosyltransferase
MIAAADVLAHPARRDITGAAILQAIVDGLPVVASGCRGIAEHVRISGAGKVIGEPSDARACRRALAEAGRSAGDFALRRFDDCRCQDLFGGLTAAADAIEAVGVSLARGRQRFPQRRL